MDIHPFGAITSDPAGDAADHFNAQEDTFWKVVELFGVELTIEVNKHSRDCVDLSDDKSNDWYRVLNSKTLRELAAQAISKDGTL